MENEVIAAMAEEEQETVPAPETDTPPVRKRRGGRRPVGRPRARRRLQRRPGRLRLREEQKLLAENLKPEVYVQYEGAEIAVNDLVDAARAEFRKEKKRTRITGMKLYVKPEERTAYYVINEKSEGKVAF